MSSEKTYLLEPNDLKNKEQQNQVERLIKNYKTFKQSNVISSHYIYINVQKRNHGLTSCFRTYIHVDTDMISYNDTNKCKTYICYDGYFYILIDFEKDNMSLYKLPINYKFSYGPDKYDAVISDKPLSKFKAGNSELIYNISIQQQLKNVKDNIENSHVVLQEKVEGYKISFTFM
jgi:hypothetical protein